MEHTVRAGGRETGSSLDKALDLLFYLHASDRPQGVTAIGRALGLPKSSVHRLAKGLVERSLLERDDRGQLRPGPALIALGLGALAREPVVELAQPILQEEARALGETVFLTAARAGRILVLDKVEGSGFLRAAPRVGEAVPVHATAVGKLFLAHAPDQVQPPPLHPELFTARTPRRGELDRAVEQARETGLAENHGEWIEGLSVVAAAVFDPDGALVAALAVAGTTARMQVLGRARVAARAAAAARRISDRLAGTGALRRGQGGRP